MANIQKVTDRHYWQAQKLHAPDHDEADGRGFVLGLLCTNCRAYRLPGHGDPPVTGCAAGVNLKRAGRARTGDYEEQEMRIREQQERVDPSERPDLEFDRVPRHEFDRFIQQQGGLS